MSSPLHIHGNACYDMDSFEENGEFALSCDTPGYTQEEFDALTVIDGLLVDTGTGEVVGLASDAAIGKPRFVVDSFETAEWVIERLYNFEAANAALDAKLAGIAANIQAMKQQNLSAIAHLHHRFDADLQAFTAEQIKGGKARSVKTAFGTLGFRTNPGKIEAKDQTAAIAWCDKHAKDAVKRDPKLSVSALKGREGDLPAGIFDVTDKHDTFYIKTGAGGGAATKGSE